MDIVIGTDLHGFHLKETIMHIKKMPGGDMINWIDVGCFKDYGCHYPEQAQAAVEMIRAGRADLGILLCGTGVGMSIAANRFVGIYAGLAWNEEIARLNREHDKVNVLVLPADYLTPEHTLSIICAWLGATFQGGRHQDRIDQINSFGGL